MSIEPIIPIGYTEEEYEKKQQQEWEDHLKTLPHVPEGKDVKKVYNVICKSEDDWKYVHEILLQDGTLEDNIPSDKQECVNEYKLYGIIGSYMLNDFEVSELRKHPRVQSVQLDRDSYPGSFRQNPDTFLQLDRYSTASKHYRNLNFGQNLSTNSGAELHRAGYQLLRSTQKTCRWGNAVNTVINDKVEYLGDGKDVDIVVADNAAWFGHPEFNNTCVGGGPQLYTGGNVLPGNGTCDVLDIVLDLPYYLDPEWFNTPNAPGQPGYIEVFHGMDGSSDKLETRWDGTIVPVEKWATRWWTFANCRSHVDPIGSISGGFSSTFPDFGMITGIAQNYSRAAVNGSNNAYPTDSRADHATQCMSQVYGNTLGYAFNANKWYISLLGTERVADNTYYQMMKVFQDNKPINPSHGNKNPTIASNSWSSVQTVLGAGYYYFRQGTSGSGGVQYETAGSGNAPEWLTNIGNGGALQYVAPYPKNSSHGPIFGKAMIDSGVIFVVAAGNYAQKMVTSDHPDYNNYVSVNPNEPLGTDDDGTEDAWYHKAVNRIGYPGMLGQYTDPSTGKEVYPAINVGAIDDFYDNSSNYHTPSGKERKAWYSSMGNAIDCYAPGDGTLAAFGLDSTLYTQHASGYSVPAQYPGLNKSAYHRYFNGTSSACPTAAGIIATKLQTNRSWGWAEVKEWINDKCGVQSQDDFYYGEEPTTVDSILWRDDESLMGGTAKLIWDASTVNDDEPPTPDVYGCTDPNATNYDPNATINDGTCDYAPSDWYVGWEKWTPQTAWVKASEGASGWYLTDPQGWSQFMKDYAMFPSNTNPLPDQDHTATWRFHLPGQPGDYTLECQCDGRATFVWDTEETLGTITSGALPIGPHNTSTNFGVSTTSARDHWITATINNIGGGSVWNMNPGGVAWILKDARNGLPTFGDIVARSSDSFPQTASGAWGSFMNTYAVFPSTTDPLIGQTIETTYVFTHEGGQVMLEVAADGEATFLIDDVIVGSTSNPFTSDIITVGSSGFTSSVSTSSFQNGVPAGNRKLTVRINNTSATSFPNTWSANPGGVAFVATNASGTVLKTSLNVGQQPTPTANTQVLGCTDPNATNYDPNANVDDGSCTYGPISGCTDPNATNYNPNATIDDGSCVYAPGGNNNLEQKDVLNTVHFPVMSNVKFSQLRNTFRDKNPSGTIKASELRRRTSKTNMDPVVPDSTENTPIATTVNWKV